MKCHIQIDAKLKNCVLFGIDKQVPLLGFDPYRSGTTKFPILWKKHP
jgi:hypothetical protein